MKSVPGKLHFCLFGFCLNLEASKQIQITLFKKLILIIPLVVCANALAAVDPRTIFAFENDALARKFSTGNGVLQMVRLVNNHAEKAVVPASAHEFGLGLSARSFPSQGNRSIEM